MTEAGLSLLRGRRSNPFFFDRQAERLAGTMLPEVCPMTPHVQRPFRTVAEHLPTTLPTHSDHSHKWKGNGGQGRTPRRSARRVSLPGPSTYRLTAEDACRARHLGARIFTDDVVWYIRGPPKTSFRLWGSTRAASRSPISSQNLRRSSKQSSLGPENSLPRETR